MPMKIAVVGPSPIPYTRGGVENLMQGIYQAINRSTPHCAELIKVPVHENTFMSLVTAYRKFSGMRLDDFDLIITLKYPGWMIRHPNHVVYLCHRLRGLYDTYTGGSALQKRRLQSPFRFPGPLIRKLVHRWDNRAISPRRIAGMFCISKTVAGRSEYFHPELTPQVLYPPPVMERFHCADSEHFLAVSRLDAPKRMDLIIKAYGLVPGKTPLLIAGSGTQAAYLQHLAQGDDRISFLGDVSDEVLVDLYAHSIAVIYTPHEEDYGFITVEAMKSSKPVITTLDSGGPIEFVDDRETGYVVTPDPVALADRISELDTDRILAAEMGRKALKKTISITWDDTVFKLLKPYQFWPERGARKPGERRRILVLVPYRVHPPRGGGQRRVASIYSRLARVYDVWLLVVGRYGEERETIELEQYLHEIVVPPAPAHAEEEWALEKELGVAVSDISLPSLIGRSYNFARTLSYFMDCCDIVISSHPYLHPFIKPTDRCKTVIHESHNFEWELKSKVLPSTPTGSSLLNDTASCEKDAVTGSDILLTVSQEEGKILCAHYGRNNNSFHVVPNGADTEEVKPVSDAIRQEAKKHFNLSNHPVVLFVGAWHPPNLEAFQFIIDTLAPALPAIRFLVVGSVLDQYKARVGTLAQPDNVMTTGVVPEDVRLKALAAADIALNPMQSGSGTNLKIVEYFAAGLSVISTPEGIRGIDVVPGRELMVTDLAHFDREITRLSESREERIALGVAARKKAEKQYSWEAISNHMIDVIEGNFPERDPVSIPLDDDLYFPNGWFPVEQWPIDSSDKFMMVRWSHPRAQLIVPARRRTGSIQLHLCGAPGGSRISIFAREQLLFKDDISNEWQDIVVHLPPEPGEDTRQLSLKSSTWSPAESGSRDTRQLGVALSGIIVEKTV
jgi:glycosyltransferase involved in cell wall biosynthesis